MISIANLIFIDAIIIREIKPYFTRGVLVRTKYRLSRLYFTFFWKLTFSSAFSERLD